MRKAQKINFIDRRWETHTLYQIWKFLDIVFINILFFNANFVIKLFFYKKTTKFFD